MVVPRTFTSANPDPIDIAIGERIRLRRTMLCMSRRQLANALGITSQQVQKYESASNRVSAATLVLIARQLSATAAWLIGEEIASSAGVPQ
jgi:transcriptional regulator with XRE-family HTH domain